MANEDIETWPIKLVQIQCTADHILGVDYKGQVWYRDKLPYSYAITTGYNRRDELKKEDGIIWKPMPMRAQVPPQALPAPAIIVNPEAIPAKRIDEASNNDVVARAEDEDAETKNNLSLSVPLPKAAKHPDSDRHEHNRNHHGNLYPR